jgi:hypothetical protein
MSPVLKVPGREGVALLLGRVQESNHVIRVDRAAQAEDSERRTTVHGLGLAVPLKQFF